MFRRTVSFLFAGIPLCVATLEAQAVRLSESDGLKSPPASRRVSSPREPKAFGEGIQQRMIAAAEFVPELSNYSFLNSYGTEIRPTAGGFQRFAAPLDLPAGAIIEEILLLVDDADAALDITGQFVFSAHAASGVGACDSGWIEADWTSTSAGIDGRGIVVLQDDEPYVVRSRAAYPPGCPENHLLYGLAVSLQSMSHSLAGAVVRWHRSVSPAPAAATFGDVPTDHPLFQFVEALAASGITAGCGGGNYCPGNPLTRGQMAVFLSIALGLHWPL
jgi:hypothetical protein